MQDAQEDYFYVKRSVMLVRKFEWSAVKKTNELVCFLLLKAKIPSLNQKISLTVAVTFSIASFNVP